MLQLSQEIQNKISDNFTYQPQTTASFDVDCQKGFTPLCPDELPVQDGDQIVDELNAQAKFAQWRLGSKDAHPSNPLWIAKIPQDVLTPVLPPANNIDVYWPLHCVAGTQGCELLDGLPAPENYDFFVWKGVEPHLHPYGACYHDLHNRLSTGVIEFLHSKNINLIIVGGLATDYCVANTAKQLKNAGFHIIVNLGACRGVATDSTQKTIDEFTKLNIVMINSASELIA
jgi:nicotinamidase/pyrazinamidase